VLGRRIRMRHIRNIRELDPVALPRTRCKVCGPGHLATRLDSLLRAPSQSGEAHVTISAAAAYRLDTAARNPAAAVDDADRAIVAAAVLQHAALLPAPQRPELLRDAIEVAIEIVGEPEVERIATREWQNVDRTPSEAIVLLAEMVQHVGNFNLARVLLDGVLQTDDSLTVVQRGRVLAARARIAWKLGFIDDARERYEFVERLARRAKSAELKARASIGLASLAQMRGNYPDVQRHAKRAARIADGAGFREIGRKAHNALMIAASVTERLDDALVHGWAAYKASDGDPVSAGEALQNLGQVLFNAGHVDLARTAFIVVTTHELPARILLPALGSLALVGARSKEPTLVRWAAGEVERIDSSILPQFAVASALAECAAALAAVQRPIDAERCRKRASALAETYGFHEVAYRMETLSTLAEGNERVKPATLQKPSANVVAELEWMKPERLPAHVRLATASG
jgi:tetratricopeptide (TPR) repeat protein